MGWQHLPEPILCQIFRHLSASEVVLGCSLVCRHWYVVSHDNLLWKHLFIRNFKVSRNTRIRCPESSWHDEYKRLMDDIPTVLEQTLTDHKDEVLHVAFSHDGTEFVSCSKDHSIIVWTDHERKSFESCRKIDMASVHWIHTWGSEFSPDDTKVLVAGVLSSINGELAIFSTGRTSHSASHGNYQLLCRVMNDPYDIFGCWASSRLFLSGTIISYAGVASTVWLCETQSRDDGLDRDEEDPADSLIDLNAPKKALFKFRSENSSIFARFLQCYSRAKIHEDEGVWVPGDSQEPAVRRDPYLDGDFVDLPFEPQGLSSSDIQDVIEAQVCAAFICGDRTSIPHQVGFQRLTSRSLENDPLTLPKPEKVIDLNGHIVGIAVSPEHSELYVNVRSWPENAMPSMDNPPPISNQIELKVIDLKTMTVQDNCLHGHIGYTPSDKAFYLYLSVSTQLVGSGSEDKKGYLWDRHYKCNVAKLAHEACVNSAVIRPACNEDTAVTASDDFTIRVWRSKRSLRSKS